ncbi:putative ribonuclease H-like domain-containing protein [Tanacetum coccineum]
MGDENPIRTLGDYSKPSHEGYRNTIELPVGNNVVPLRSDTIRLVQNGCSFHGLGSEDPNQHLKDFLKLKDSLDLDGSITTWEDLTTRFLAQFFPPGRNAKLRNDILEDPKKNDVKARSMLMMALLNEHLLTFNQYKDAKTLYDAIQIRFGGNDATKKKQKTLLKQMYENFNAPRTLSLTGFKKLNKPDLDSMSFDDLYNNFKIVEQEVKRTTSSNSNSNSQNMAFVSSPSSTNDVKTANVQISTASSSVSTDSTQDSTANLSDATVYAFLANQPNGSQLVHEDLEQIHEDDLEEMDLKWQLALLSMRARRYYQRTRKKITINGSDTAGYDKSKVECFNCHKMGHFARECKSPRNQESRSRNHDNRNRNQDSSRRTMNVEETSSKEMVAIDGAGFVWSFMAEEEVTTNMALMAFSDSEFNLATYKRGLASVEEQLVFYKKNEVMFCDQIVVLKRDASFKDSEIIAHKSEIEKLKKEKECYQIKIDKFENASKCLDKLIGSQISDNSRKGVGYNVVPPRPTGLFAPPTIDLSNSGLEEFQQPEFKSYGPKASKSVCVDTSNEVKKTPDTLLVEELVLEKGKQTIFPTKIKFVKQQNKTARKPVKPKAVNTARPHSAVVNVVKDNQANVVKASACWVWRPTKLNSASITLKKHNYIDARGRSKSLMEDMLPLVEDSDEEKSLVNVLSKRVSLIFRMCSLSRSYNSTFLVSHRCVTKNCVLFTDTACFILSLDFKLPDDSQILLKIPRKHNMYNVDIKNIVPKESLTCLVAKARLDESMLWHRRLGHVNFKTINKLVKDNLVRGLPSKHFEIDQTCVACLEGKQHKASCKSKVQNSITQPLFMLHMDLFGLTFMSSLMNKKYCLVVTDDYSRFTWVFFLSSKDETSGILKNFITEIENLADKKVKIIRCDNGTEFKNRVMNEFCKRKGIKRDYSVARTP